MTRLFGKYQFDKLLEYIVETIKIQILKIERKCTMKYMGNKMLFIGLISGFIMTLQSCERWDRILGTDYKYADTSNGNQLGFF